MVFVGPSGCGKSTLLRMIAGLEEITGGDLMIDGKRVNRVGPADRGLAMVFQSYALYPAHDGAAEHGVRLRLAACPRPNATARSMRPRGSCNWNRIWNGGRRICPAVSASASPSGGRSCASRRCSCSTSRYRTSTPRLRGQMRIELLRLHEELNATMIYVTHDQVEAMTMADKIVVLQAGRVEQVGSPLELYHHPGEPVCRRLHRFSAHEPDGGQGRRGQCHGNIGLDCRPARGSRFRSRADAVRTGDAVTLGIRPEGLRIDPAGPIAATVALVERLGGLTLLHVTPRATNR